MAQSVEDALVVRMEASLRKFERQMEGGRKAAVKAATGSEQAWAKAGNKIVANSNRATTGLSRLASISGRGRFVLQNTANQIGDIAVQMQGGTSASRALGLQIPQLLGGFGALGGALGLVGPLLGTVAALGIPVAAALLNMGEKAETLDDKLKALAESTKAVRAAQELSSISAVELLRDYGDLADEAQAIFDINRQIAAFKAQGALDTAARGVASELGVEGVFGFSPDEVRDLEQAIADLKAEQVEALAVSTGRRGGTEAKMDAAKARIEEINDELRALKTVQKNVDDLGAALGISADEATEVVAMFARIGQAQGAQEQAQAASDLADYIYAVSDGLKGASDEGWAFYDNLGELVVTALELAAVDHQGNLAKGTAEAGRLKEELAAALALFNQISLAGSKQYSGRGGDPRNVGNDQYTRELGYQSVDDLIAKYSPKSKGRGGGKAADGLNEAKRLYQDTRTEAEKYAAEVERINDLHRKFPEIVTTEVRDRALASLNEAANGLGNIADRMERGFEDAFVAFVTGAGNARDAARALAQDLARMAFRSAFKGLGVGDLFDSIFGGIPAFASGTNSAPGGLALVGERGPELVNLPRGSQVIPARSTAQMMAGGAGGAVTLSYAPVIDARGADQAAVARLEAAMVQQSRDFEARVQQTLRQGNNRRVNRAWSN